ncbi:mechanosensitive ion channel family protein [Fodinibius salsisoli]|uniref:Mechanosensitive ion channel family protein n=1 Tax=Fodinibius salsisoli TaxID=2820877 RepID=A0ABT3PPB6_9BACT|nr:mechanosensitive ion channel family protein [Fodinibius salsisoli]MCW9707709.1 mechanosensitive ion channel family protein [Fodinibius salsisoli]
MDFLQESLFDINTYLSEETIQVAIKLAIFIAIILPVIFLLRGWARRFFTKKYAPHYGMLAGKVVLYSGVVIIIITVMTQLGISLAPLLGAAGIVGIALGFASQTSVSNIISGLFLIAEQPFKVDDIITINATTGIVMSIDVLSVKLRTFDNQFVRIPNETLIKSEVINVTRFPIRRLSAKVSVAYKEDIGQVREILMEVAEKNQYALSEPEPLIVFEAFGASSIDLSFKVWSLSEEHILLRNTIQEEIKQTFDNKDIEIPFPHVSLYTGSATSPIPIQMVDGAEKENPEDGEETLG